ncbi:hypothetical protein GLF_0958 [Gluconobacter frateurii NBRC 101659]|nr:hypothetical protein GLF_0958 [Gluconobacter frateurii NBRC 101659]
MECFRIDESGYTGFDLLNPQQRFQGAAAIAISDADASRLIKEHFPRLQSKELKYRALSRRPGNRPHLLALLRDLLQNYKCVTHVLDKRFLLILMFCDYAVEPWYYKHGFNLYADGQNYAMGSLLSAVGPKMLGAEPFEAMLAAFQRAMKEKTPESLSALVASTRRTNWQTLPEVIGPLARDACPDCLSAIVTPGVSTDLAMVVLIALISRMEVMADGPYRVEHDESKNLTTYHDMLQALINHTDQVELRQTAITNFKLPLKLTEVIQVNSKNSPAIQLADVMIGAALEAGNIMTGHRAEGLDPDDLLALFRDDQLIHMLPDLDFGAQKEFRRGTQASEIIDYFAANFASEDRGA